MVPIMETAESMMQLKFTPRPVPKAAKSPFDLKDGEAGKFLVTLEGCHHCEEKKKEKAEELKKGELKEIHCSDNRGEKTEFENLKFMVENDYLAFPTILNVERHDGTFKICELNPETNEPDQCKTVRKN